MQFASLHLQTENIFNHLRTHKRPAKNNTLIFKEGPNAALPLIRKYTSINYFNKPKNLKKGPCQPQSNEMKYKIQQNPKYHHQKTHRKGIQGSKKYTCSCACKSS